MRFDIITIFPEFFSGIFGHGVVKRAIGNGLIDVDVHDLPTCSIEVQQPERA